MGAGVGLSAHASHRIVTERIQLAMPEAAIGFAPDAGSTYLLSRLPGELGAWMGMTGARLGAGDVLGLGLADGHLPAAALGGLADGLARAGADALLAAIGSSAPPPSGVLSRADRELIDHCFVGETVEEIAARLRGVRSAAAATAAAALGKASPTSLKVTLAALRRAAELDTLEECLAQELRTSASLLATDDFAEGIRAAVVDEDRSPRWTPSSLAAVEEIDVARVLDGPDDLADLWAPVAGEVAVAAALVGARG
jgi:enoyl-CoA hydratase/carnithine racemase